MGVPSTHGRTECDHAPNQWIPAAGERPPRTLGLDLSLLFRHACCMPGAMRDWIFPPREGGPIRLSCWTVYIACHGEAASPRAGCAAYPTLLEVSFICLLVLLYDCMMAVLAPVVEAARLQRVCLMAQGYGLHEVNPLGEEAAG